MAIGGTYRINNNEFPAPITNWTEQLIAGGLNAIPILSLYRIHTWQWSELSGEIVETLFGLFESQQSANAQLAALETDPYDATGAELAYGTTAYIDFIIQSLSPRRRGLPQYQDVTVTFEVDPNTI